MFFSVRWKPYRNKLTYYLAAGKVKEIYPLMRDIVPKLDSYIDSVKGEEIDVSKFMLKSKIKP